MINFLLVVLVRQGTAGVLPHGHAHGTGGAAVAVQQLIVLPAICDPHNRVYLRTLNQFIIQ